MKKIVLLAEKPSYLKNIEPHLAQVWPNSEIHAHFVNFSGPFRFSYPRGLKWADYPRTAEPSYHYAKDWMRPMRFQNQFNRDTAHDTFEALVEDLKTADEIVNACDTSYNGVTAFAIALRQCGLDWMSKTYPTLGVRSFLPHHGEETLKTPLRFPDDYAAELRFGLAKRFFDFNFNMNALVAFNRALTEAGASPNTHLSKYGIQLLYFVRGHVMTEGEIHHQMVQWTGTGKYKPSIELGSPASRGAILNQLQIAGLLKAGNLTEAGERLLNFCHPDCEDPDLPFRLKQWCEAGLQKAKPAMERYLKTYFGKQKRYITGNHA